jgi:hypothetical protein
LISVKKLAIGIKPPVKLFRVDSLWGETVDAILVALDEKAFGKDYYTAVGVSDARDQATIRNDDGSHSLTIAVEHVVFQKNTYGSGAKLNLDKAVDEFVMLWPVLNDVLRMRDVRRIGVVGEARFYDVTEPSKMLVEKLTRLSAYGHPSKFHLHFERRLATKEGLAPDVAKDDFENLICTFYESSLDTDRKDDRAFNANLDFQRYYAPPLAQNSVVKETRRLFEAFQKHFLEFDKKLNEMGLSGE